MSDLVDQQFPPIHRPWISEYTDFNYWRPPLQIYNFPTLSKDSSPSGSRPESPSQGTFHRLRQFSLGRASSKSLFLSNDRFVNHETEVVEREVINGHPKFPASKSVDETRWRGRRVSGGSMPGSLPKSAGYPVDAFDEEGSDSEDLDENEEQEGHEASEGDGQSIPEDELFLEDLLATGEMKNVPFL